MADGKVQVAPDGTGAKIDTSELTVGANTVERQRVNISDPTTAAAHAAVANATPAGTEYGVITRPANPPADRTTIAQNLSLAATTNAVSLAVPGCSSATITITGTWTGNLTFEATTDGTTWIQWLAAYSPGATGHYFVPTTGANTNFIAPVAGFAQVRVRCTTTGTGTAVVSIEASNGAFTMPADALVISADAQGNQIGMFANAFGLAWNGANWDRRRAASAATISASSGLGVGVVAAPGNWNASHAPATNVKATITQAAGGAGVRHVATGISAALAALVTAPAAINLTLNLIDGASGGTTYLLRRTISLPAVGGEVRSIDLTGLSLFGTAATGMTLEFSAAGGINTIESVTLMGYDVS